MNIFGAFTLSLLIQIAWGQNHIPNDLKTSSVLVIEYNYHDWDGQFLDSTRGQWVLNRYGKDRLYKSYKEAFDEAARMLKKHLGKVTIVDSRSPVNKHDFDYIFDYKQKIVDNHESIVADKRLGGFYFENLQKNEKYDPIVENRKYIKRVIRSGL